MIRRCNRSPPRVDPVLGRAAIAASHQLDTLGVRHALIGGLAIGAWGRSRSTDDVDFLVSDDAFIHQEGGLVTLPEGYPIAIGDIRIDSMGTAEDAGLEEALRDPPFHPTLGVPVVELWALVYTKLRAWRPRDREDLCALVEEGHLDVRDVRSPIAKYAPELLPRLAQIGSAA